MLVTIITIARNAENFIERTIKSVNSQNYPDIQYIVIDGASTDRTLEIIQRHSTNISNLVSEPDAGISDAWNKGLKLATGKVIGLLNAGDEYAPTAVQSAVQAAEAGADIAFGDTDLVDAEGRVLSRNVGKFHPWKRGGGIGIYHPSCFFDRKVYETIGGFSVSMKFAMDVDWIFRATAAGFRLKHSDVKVRMLADGISVKNRYLAYGEYLQCLSIQEHGQRQAYLSMIATGTRGLARSLLGRG